MDSSKVACTGRCADPSSDVLQGSAIRGDGVSLPISQSGFRGMVLPNSTYPADYDITGSGESYSNCGSFYTVGCLNVDEHVGSNLDGVDMDGKAYLERHKQSCHRALCPVCWPDWANREKDKATQRLRAFSLKGRVLKPIHVIVSVPVSDYGLSLQSMRQRVYGVLKKVHCLGGMLIYHSKRQEKRAGLWYYSPHFHMLGYGWIVDVRATYAAFGYVVKNVGIRKTIEGTIYYQLSHCAVPSGFHAVTWFGCLGYGKLRVRYEKERCCCPICGGKLYRLIWIGAGTCELPEVEGVGFFDSAENWLIRPVRWRGCDE